MLNQIYNDNSKYNILYLHHIQYHLPKDKFIFSSDVISHYLGIQSLDVMYFYMYLFSVSIQQKYSEPKMLYDAALFIILIFSFHIKLISRDLH